MLFDILAVFVVSLISSLFCSTASVHGLPAAAAASSSALHYSRSHPRAALSSSLRLLEQHHQPLPSVDYDLGGDISAMLIGESNELSSANEHHGSSAASVASSEDSASEPVYFYRQSAPSKSSSRKLFFSAQRHPYEQYGDETGVRQRKRFTSSVIHVARSLPAHINVDADMTATEDADESYGDNIVDDSRLAGSPAIAPSLQAFVDNNPIARRWLNLLLKRVMEEQSVPYIFKYGRRRK